ncbi:MAG TPA: peptidoglycan-binding domain-containing protein [Kiloniellales bacterium]|nr:peptidoglycan-binding domain-containing protein [Kiloniellales bacterium]
MRRLLTAFALLIILAGLLPGPVEARRLLQDGAIEAHVPDGDWCGERIYVELRTPVQESFAGDAYQVRRAVAILATLLPLECPQAREMELVGTVAGVAVWRAAAGASSGELRVLPSPSQEDLVPLDERQRTIEIQRTLNSLGFDAGAPDGMAGPRTRAAIRSWRASRGLAGNDRASADVLLALRREHGAASMAGAF